MLELIILDEVGNIPDLSNDGENGQDLKSSFHNALHQFV